MKSLRTQLSVSAALCALGLFPGCGPTAQLKRPPEFAQYRDARPHFKAVSADGIRMRARREENQPKSDVGLWQESIRGHLKHEGYRIVEEGDVKAKDGGANGRRILSLYRFQEQDYVYLVALFVRGAYVFIVEAAGPYKQFTTHKQNIEESLRSFETK